MSTRPSVPLIPRFASSVPQGWADLGIGTLGGRGAGQCPPLPGIVRVLFLTGNRVGIKWFDVIPRKEFPMRFQSGQSGNPAGRPPGSLNKKTLEAQEAMIERAQEVIDSIVDRAKNGESAAMRAAMERLVPAGANRRVAIDLPVIKTPEDAELALSVVTDELSAGTLTIAEASALVNLIDRMLRVAERMWNFARARRYGAKRDAILLD